MGEPDWKREVWDKFDPEKVAKQNIDTDYGIEMCKKMLKEEVDKGTFCQVCRVELSSREKRRLHISVATECRKTRRERKEAVKMISNPPEMGRLTRIRDLIEMTKDAQGGCQVSKPSVIRVLVYLSALYAKKSRR